MLLTAVSTPAAQPRAAASNPFQTLAQPANRAADGFLSGMNAVADPLLRFEAKLGGGAGALQCAAWGAEKLLELSGSTAHVSLSGLPAGIALVSVLAVGGAIAYGGWKAGGWVAEQGLSRLDAQASRVGGQGGEALKALPKAALAILLASQGSVSVNGVGFNLGLPAGGAIALGGLMRLGR